MAFAYSARLETMEARRAQIGRRAAIELTLGATPPAVVGCRKWAPRASRRHHAGAKLPDDFFPRSPPGRGCR